MIGSRGDEAGDPQTEDEAGDPQTGDDMVHEPARGAGPIRFGPSVPTVPDIGTGILDAEVYTDPERYERERATVLRRNWQVICRSSEIPNPGDFLRWEGHGETVLITRRRDGGVSGFHNVCQHRGARIVSAASGCARRFTCRWHSWVYDLEGSVVGVPDREDFDPGELDGLAAPPLECSEWGGWVWAVLAGPGVAPPLLEWLGADITQDLGVYRMETMTLIDKIVWEVPVNWKVIIDAFNENYHAAHLHSNNTKPQDVRDGRFSTYFVFGQHGMMVIPYKGVLPRLRETLDHQSMAICHYTLFPTAVFNCNPTHIQLFRAVPLAVDRSRFECWELQYPDGDDEYVTKVNEHWGRLQGVVAEDVEIWNEVAATQHSFGYRRNILNDRECKITAFHRAVQDGIRADDPAQR
jgi:phenylpropionate dioxygenase-like ring-hydroxylating dioxygenase large terminal subunit